MKKVIDGYNARKKVASIVAVQEQMVEPRAYKAKQRLTCRK